MLVDTYVDHSGNTIGQLFITRYSPWIAYEVLTIHGLERVDSPEAAQSFVAAIFGHNYAK